MNIETLLDETELLLYVEGTPHKVNRNLRWFIESNNNISTLYVRSVDLLESLQGYALVLGNNVNIELLTKPYLKNLNGNYTINKVVT